MRVVALTQSQQFGSVLKTYCEPCGIHVAEYRELDGMAASLARLADVLIIHRPHVDGVAISLIENATRAGFRETFLISTEPIRPEWEERAYLAGATNVSSEPVRAALLVAQLRRVSARPALKTGGAETPRALPVAQPDGQAPAAGAGPADLASTKTLVRLLKHAHSADSFTDTFFQHLSEQISVNRLALYLSNAEHDRADLNCTFATGVEPEMFRHVALSLDRGIGGYLRTHGTVLTLNSHLHPDAHAADEMQALGVDVAVPVADRNSLIGVLLLGRHITGELLRRDEIELVFHLMSAMGLVLRNARLNRHLTEERTFFASVLEQMGVGSMVIDEQLRVLHANRRMADAIEHQDQAPVRFEHLPQSLATAVYNVLRAPNGTGRTVMLRTARGETYRATVDPFRLSSATSAGVLVLTHNYTEVEQLRITAVDAERNELLGRMAHQFGHVVRNSLTNLHTMTQLLPREHRNAAFVTEFCAKVPGDLQRILHAADQLDWMRRGIGEPVIIADLEGRISRTWTKTVANFGVEKPPHFKVMVSPSLAVFCDAGAFDAIFVELFRNALQAVPRGGGVVEVLAETSDHCVTLHVHDDGAGFTTESLDRATEPFFTTETTGVGLGLAVVDHLVRASRGKLTLGASRRLKGADVAFTFSIPKS